jgi:hypothetical protein
LGEWGLKRDHELSTLGLGAYSMWRCAQLKIMKWRCTSEVTSSMNSGSCGKEGLGLIELFWPVSTALQIVEEIQQSDVMFSIGRLC